MKTYLFLIFFVAFMSTEAAPPSSFIPQEIVGLKTREPHWQSKTVEFYPDEIPKLIRFYDNGLSVKEIELSKEGRLVRESDLQADRYEGPTVFYSDVGTIDTLVFYKDSVLEGSYKTFFPNGALRESFHLHKGVKEGSYALYTHEGIFDKGTYLSGVLQGKREKYFPSGKISFQGEYQGGVLEGEVNEWDEQGNLVLKAYFHQGLLHGEVGRIALTRYYPDRALLETADFRYGIPQGTHLKYHPGGKISYRCPYIKGQKHGIEEAFAPSGNLILSGEYSKGIPIGRHVENYSTGQLSRLSTYSPQGKLLEPILEFDLKGTKRISMEEGQYLEWDDHGMIKRNLKYKNELLEGVAEEFHPQGNIAVRANFSAGVFDGTYEAYTLEGSPLCKCSYKLGKRTGPFLTWFKDGNPQLKAFYIDGQPDGEHIEWHPNGKQMRVTHFSQGKREGISREWNSSGELISEASYKKDLPDGVVAEWHPGGILKSHLLYKAGLKEGEERHYFSSGELAWRGSFKANIPEGVHMGYFPDGAVREKQSYSKGKPAGEYLHYFEQLDSNGNHPLAKKGFYKEGKLHGQQQLYFFDGSLNAVIGYKQGLLDGKKAFWKRPDELIEEAFYHNGQLTGSYYQKKSDGFEIVSEYQDNKLYGLYQVFYPLQPERGKIKAFEAYFSNGQLDGDLAEYNTEGTKILSAVYRTGKREDILTLYSPDGKVLFTAEFSNDLQHGRTSEYYPNGQVFKQANFEFDLKEGEEVTFHENGNRKALNQYKKGNLDGLCKEWSAAGVLIFEAHFKDGRKNGLFIRYDEEGHPLVEMQFIDDQMVGSKRIYGEAA